MPSPGDVPASIAVIVGSLRKESFSRKTARALIELSPPAMQLEIHEIGQLSHYNQDLDTETPPAPWAEFRTKVRGVAGVIFVTPEYNRSVPGVLKNAIDVGSRPYGKSAFQGKPAGVVSVSPGTLGAFGANHHLRQSLVFLNMPPLQQPEVYLSNVGALFDGEGKLTKAETRDFLGKFLTAFADWVGANTKKSSG